MSATPTPNSRPTRPSVIDAQISQAKALAAEKASQAANLAQTAQVKAPLAASAVAAVIDKAITPKE